jgi:hypothetical protein
MGSNCGDDKTKTVGVLFCGPSTLDAPSIEQKCDGADNTFCISAWASVGSIKHDLCCEKNHNDGFMCKGEARGTNCELEWAHAMLDWKLQEELPKMHNIKAVTIFPYRWKYFFNGSDKTSYGPNSDETNWWKGMLPAGDVITGYDVEYWYDLHNYNFLRQYISRDEFEGTQLCSGEEDIFELDRKNPLRVPFSLFAECAQYFPNLFPQGMWIRAVHVCKKTIGDFSKTLVTPQGKIDSVGNKITPSANLKAKKVTRAGCNKVSSVSSPSTVGAEGALNKYSTGTDGCAQ